jgi:hypothetical protein
MVLWLPFTILYHYKYTNCQILTEEGDSSGNWPMSNLLETIKE